MTRIGITGHQGLPAAAVPYIATHVQKTLRGLPEPLIGYSSLAEGADQLVADQILRAGGQLHVVIPSRDYESTFDDTGRRTYENLLGAATHTSTLPFAEPSEEAYDAAGKWVAEHCDVLIAVWDGEPARGLGGTADAVAHARALAKDIRIIWPAGIER